MQQVTTTMCELLTLVKNHNLDIIQCQLELVIEHILQFVIRGFLKRNSNVINKYERKPIEITRPSLKRIKKIAVVKIL